MMIFFAIILISMGIAGLLEYVRPVRPSENSYDNALQKYLKACRTTIRADLKRSLIKLCGRNKTPWIRGFYLSRTPHPTFSSFKQTYPGRWIRWDGVFARHKAIIANLSDITPRSNGLNKTGVEWVNMRNSEALSHIYEMRPHFVRIAELW